MRRGKPTATIAAPLCAPTAAATPAHGQGNPVKRVQRFRGTHLPPLMATGVLTVPKAVAGVLEGLVALAPLPVVSDCDDVTSPHDNQQPSRTECSFNWTSESCRCHQYPRSLNIKVTSRFKQVYLRKSKFPSRRKAKLETQPTICRSPS